jgi:hypothetical protein
MNKEVENEKEFVDRDEEAISRLVGDLRHVEAPANFERRVMSQIAEGEPKTPSLFSFPAIVLAASAVVVLLVGSIVFYNMRRTVAQENEVVQMPVTTPVRQSTAPAQPPVAPLSSPNPETAARNDREPAQQITAPYRQIQRPLSIPGNSNSGGGSFDRGQNQIKPLYPQGFDPKPRRNNTNTSEVISTESIPVKDVLMMLGISAEFKDAWIIQSVSKNSSGERSGVKVGDLIDAIGDSRISADTNYRGGGRFTTIAVRRDGQSLVLKLK